MMKKLIFTLIFTALMISLAANPIILKAVARVWFNAEGEFMVMFGDEGQAAGMPFDYHAMSFSTNSGIWQLPASYQIPGVPWAVNFSQEIPDFMINPNADEFYIHSGMSTELFSWGAQDDPAPRIRPLLSGQSAVQFRVPGNQMWSVDVLGKDSFQHHLPAHEVVARSVINVHVQDYAGLPIQGLEVVRSYQNNVEQNYNHQFYTDENGNVGMESYPCRIRIGVQDPLSEAWALDESIYCEPGQIYSYSAVVTHVDNDDPIQVPEVIQLQLWPSVMGSSTDGRLNLNSGTLQSEGELRLYDLRGRYIGSHTMPPDGQTQWRLPDLDSGIYFITLRQGSRELSRARLTILK